MTRDAFLLRLRSGLAGLPPDEIDDILADYESHFEEAEAAGRRPEEVAQALGDPRRLARELRAEIGLRRWEQRRTPATFAVALLALAGLATVDLFLLLPLAFGLGLAALILCFVSLLLAVSGLGDLVSLLPFGQEVPPEPPLARLLDGLGLVAAACVGGLLLTFGLRAGLAFLGRYARLHFRVLRPLQGERTEAETNDGRGPPPGRPDDAG